MIKRLVLVIIIFVAFLSVFGNIKNPYTLEEDAESAILVEHTLNRSIKLSHDVWDLDPRLKRNCDLLCEIDGVKYYLIDKKITL